MLLPFFQKKEVSNTKKPSQKICYNYLIVSSNLNKTELLDCSSEQW